MECGTITTTQKKILTLLREYTLKYSTAPTLREIMTGIGETSTRTIYENLNGLASAGYIKRIPGKSRGIELLDHALNEWKKNVVAIPLIKHPGSDLDAPNDYFSLDRRFFHCTCTLAVLLTQDNYSGAKYREGDILILASEDIKKDDDVLVIKENKFLENKSEDLNNIICAGKIVAFYRTLN